MANANVDSIDSDSENDEVVNNHRRPHMSPRLKAFNEAIVLAQALATQWRSESAADDAEALAVNDALMRLIEQIETTRDAGVIKPQAKKSYRLACVLANGTRESVDVANLSYATIKELQTKYTESFGPFHQKIGQEFVVANGPRANDNRLF